MPGHDPLISVVLPVYNREGYVAQTIHSILAQTHSQLELIVVVDEGSADGSAAVVRGLAAGDGRIRAVFLSHGSQWRARNVGVAMARGEYIAHMDDDDVALPGRLALQLAWMRKTGVDICGTCIQKFGAADGLIWFPETHQAICHEMVFRIPMLLPTVLMRAEIAKAHPYDETLTYSDFAMLTQVGPRFRLGNLPQVLVRCRYHSGQIHRTDGIAFQEDQRRYRRPYLGKLLPDASAEDLDALTQAAQNQAFTRIESLERAGTWLLRLAQTPDAFLRQRMADRWWACCLRSTHLGLPCYRLWRQFAARFGILPKRPSFRLWAQCALRIRPASRWLG